ncbi:MAG: protein phosphatase 2C domain-containing protein [Lachnospiraceae bacterium]|jgi:serine/threonine protein phosphatase PrpC|nr:protein phosphatase 2C domain-containing protein [Lachnospiraceae bacterium]
MSLGVKVHFAMLSKEGGRPRNEDYVRADEKSGEYLFALADGLGGHGKGDEASRLAAEEACLSFQQAPPHADCLKDAFENAQRRIREEKVHRGLFSAMKTTLVLLQLDGEKAMWAHVGDSRLYMFQNNKLKSRTRDHSVPQMLALIGEIKESEIRNHPDRSRLLRALGGEEETCQCERSESLILTGRSAFLLCSDGFWELVRERDMEQTLKKSADPAEWLERMEKILQQNGAAADQDNYSAIAIWVSEE